MMQRELRAAKDVASCSAAQAAGAEASQQDLQHLQVCLPVLTPCLVFYLPDTAAGMLPLLTPCHIPYLPHCCRYASCVHSLSCFSFTKQLQVCSMSPSNGTLTCHRDPDQSLSYIDAVNAEYDYKPARLCVFEAIRRLRGQPARLLPGSLS